MAKEEAVKTGIWFTFAGISVEILDPLAVHDNIDYHRSPEVRSHGTQGKKGTRPGNNGESVAYQCDAGA